MSTAFDVRISARAERGLDRLPEKIASACVAFIFGPLAQQPYRVGGELRGRMAGLRSARRGAYRTIYRVEGDAVDVVHIDHRGDVYR